MARDRSLVVAANKLVLRVSLTQNHGQNRLPLYLRGPHIAMAHSLREAMIRPDPPERHRSIRLVLDRPRP
jgi:hypothetical protein